MSILQRGMLIFILSCLALAAHSRPFYGNNAYQSFPSFQHSTSSFGMQIDRGIDQWGYILRIRLMGIDPHKVQITPWGRHLLIRAADQEQTTYGNTGSLYGFTMHQGRFFQQVPIPQDADISRIIRVNVQNGIVLRLPQGRFQ